MLAGRIGVGSYATCEGEGYVGLRLIFEKLHIEIVDFNN